MFAARGGAGAVADDYIVAAAMNHGMSLATADRRMMRAGILSGVQDVRVVAGTTFDGIAHRYGAFFRSLEGLDQQGRLGRAVEDYFDFANPF